MKKLFLATALLVGATGFAGEISEFERGYLEGKASCHEAAPPSQGVICTLPSTQYYGSHSYSGRTKAEALLKAKPEVLGAVYTEGKYPNCATF